MPTLADSNIWLALTLSGHRFHQATRTWLQAVSAKNSVLFCRSTQQSFLRLMTTAEVLAPYGNPPLSNSKAWSIYERWRADERIAFADEPHDLEPAWKALAARDAASSRSWMDAYLAAFALSGGYRFVTTDKAFKQYKSLDVTLVE